MRGTGPLWAVLCFRYWIEPRHLIILLATGILFLITTEIVQHYHRPKAYTAEEIHNWIPLRQRVDNPAIGFDNPIREWQQDAVGRGSFVETVLARVLIDCEPAVGIVAGFGEGKSSVLNLIGQSMERGGRVIAVPFRSWLPGTETKFVESLFESAVAAIRKRFFLVQWRTPLMKYGRAISGVVPRPWGSLRELIPAESQVQQIEELTTLFSRLPTRVVFLLDEVDRMHQEELAVLLKVLRGAPEIPNLSYICAFSNKALARIISPSDCDYGIKYLEKFFPVQLPLPGLDEDLRHSVFLDQIDAILEIQQPSLTGNLRTSFNSAVDALWHQVIKYQLTNFRSLGLLLRAFGTSLHLLHLEVNAFDLLVIELVRLLLPSTHEFVYRNGQYFYEPTRRIEKWTGEIGFTTEERERASKAALDSHFVELSPPDRRLALNLLARVFPSVNSYARDKLSGLGPVILMETGAERRISDSDFFPKYFIYSVPATMFGEVEMSKFLKAIRSADEKTTASLLTSTFPPAEKRDDLRRIDFLRRLETHIEDIPDKQAEWLAYTVAKATSEMLSDHIVYIRAQRFVLSVAAKFQGDAKLQSALSNLIACAGSDRFASDIVASSTSERDKNQIITDWKGVSEESLNEAFGDRMKARYPLGRMNLPELNRDDMLAFSRWRVFAPNDASHISNFFRGVFDAADENVVRFLKWLLGAGVVYQGGAIKFMEYLYPPEDIVERLKKADMSGKQWDSEQAAAISRFRQAWREERGTDTQL